MLKRKPTQGGTAHEVRYRSNQGIYSTGFHGNCFLFTLKSDEGIKPFICYLGSSCPGNILLQQDHIKDVKLFWWFFKILCCRMRVKTLHLKTSKCKWSLVLFWLEHRRLDSSNHRSCLFALFSDATHPNERTRLPAASVWVHVIYWAISHEARALSGIWAYKVMSNSLLIYSHTHTQDP